MKKRYQAQGLQVIGIHSPEFDFEKERSRVVKATERYRLDHPIMMDNDFAFWKALQNRYWPSFYLVNPQGEIVLYSLGEMHLGERNATQFENAIQKMLDASAGRHQDFKGLPNQTQSNPIFHSVRAGGEDYLLSMRKT